MCLSFLDTSHELLWTSSDKSTLFFRGSVVGDNLKHTAYVTPNLVIAGESKKRKDGPLHHTGLRGAADGEQFEDDALSFIAWLMIAMVVKSAGPSRLALQV